VLLYFSKWAKLAPLNDRQKLEELLVRLNRVPEAAMEPKVLNGWGGINLAVLAKDGAVDLFIDAIEWLLQELRRSNP